MASNFPFSKTKCIVSEDTHVWNNRSSLNFVTSDISLTDSLNDTYVSAVGNDTQYFSTLETTGHHETIEEIHNLTLRNGKVVNDSQEVHDESELNTNVVLPETNGPQVEIFTFNGSDEIFGIQEAQDEEGNVHRYQFQFRKTNDGQLEAIPETVQLLAAEQEQQAVETEEVQENHLTEENFESQVYLQDNVEAAESLITENSKHVYAEQAAAFMENNHFMLLKNDHNQTLEVAEEHAKEMNDLNHDKYIEEIQNDVEEPVVDYQTFDEQIHNGTYENGESLDEQSDSVNEEHYESVFIKTEDGYRNKDHDKFTNHDTASNLVIVNKNNSQSESDNEAYEIVDGLPVTADGEINEETSSNIYQESPIYLQQPNSSVQAKLHGDKALEKTTNILKPPTINTTDESKKKTIIYYMVPNPDQKENLNSLSNPQKLNSVTNPRSLLKSNVIDMIISSHEERSKKIQRQKMQERRFARSKEAMQAKMFNNFINKTTIPHAPVRKSRLPRKQEIKPVNTRQDEEIIVQEVMVSSSGFVENSSERLKNMDKFEITSIVELSDSDEEVNVKHKSDKKSQKMKKPVVGATSDDSDISVIEILQSDDDISQEPTKNRGNLAKDNEDDLIMIHSAPPDNQENSSCTENQSEKLSNAEIPCVYPTQNNLETHLHLQNSQKKILMLKEKTTFEYKHKCENCLETFKNTILLQRHTCEAKMKPSKHKCNTCSKSFKDIVTFNIHKKMHLKENLVKATNTVTISPKKLVPRPSTSGFKMPALAKPSFKCKDCAKVFSTQLLLATHEKMHKKNICNNCGTTFNSKLLLTTHVRLTCVKNAGPKDKRLSFNVRKSFVHSPRRLSVRGRSPHQTIKKPKTKDKEILSTKNSNSKLNIPRISINDSRISSNSSLRRSVLDKSVNPALDTSTWKGVLGVKTQCEFCPLKFSSFRALFKHKVEVHGVKTPDKNVLVPGKKLIHKPLNEHGGIKPNARVMNAFQEIREKLLSGENQDLDLSPL